ncbi:RNA polymerase sigma-70 factor (ECF subfamily) [Nocardioides ginsengisegetis]|uniref:RNA polymerase sigma-70 factor (ECF subfamily) n=1 Tax=Nocardioides ginsengisegetis TaxID=661491 RepID=A0A7W3IYM4_9ACTN|nr:RNA polymerase sigma-70 factor (ECF subfamily) [Nocardioides ginsengisegetis]
MSTEPDLVERARRGDPAAWRELYESLSGRLLLWLRARPSGDSAADPEDLVMETWLVAADRIADFAGDADAFAGWLFGIARNQAANARRRSQRRATDPVDVTEHDIWGAQEDTDVAGEDWVRRTLATLPPRQGEVLSLMEVVGLDVAGTAEALGMSATAVRVNRHRGLARLRKQGAMDRNDTQSVTSSPSAIR